MDRQFQIVFDDPRVNRTNPRNDFVVHQIIANDMTVGFTTDIKKLHNIQSELDKIVSNNKPNSGTIYEVIRFYDSAVGKSFDVLAKISTSPFLQQREWIDFVNRHRETFETCLLTDCVLEHAFFLPCEVQRSANTTELVTLGANTISETYVQDNYQHFSKLPAPTSATICIPKIILDLQRVRENDTLLCKHLGLRSTQQVTYTNMREFLDKISDESHELIAFFLFAMIGDVTEMHQKALTNFMLRYNIIQYESQMKLPRSEIIKMIRTHMKKNINFTEETEETEETGLDDDWDAYELEL